MRRGVGLATAAWAVLRKPWCFLPLTVLLVCAISPGVPAEWATRVMALFVAMILLLAAAMALLIDPKTGQTDAFRAVWSTSWSWRQLGLAAGLIATAVAVVVFSDALIRACYAVIDRVEGDRDLAVACVWCALGAVICAVIGRWLSPRISPGDTWYWRQATSALTLAAAALLPAALLAGWAWNILASIGMPLFLLSMQRERDVSTRTHS